MLQIKKAQQAKASYSLASDLYLQLLLALPINVSYK